MTRSGKKHFVAIVVMTTSLLLGGGIMAFYLYFSGILLNPMEELQRRAADGDAESQYQLGIKLLYDVRGLNFAQMDKHLKTPIEAQKAGYQWLLKSAEAGHRYAQLNVAKCYENGIGTEKNEAKALAYYRMLGSVNHDFYEVYYKVGLALEEGILLDRNLDEARQNYRKAARGNHPAAIFHLGLLLINDPEKHEEAHALLKRVADNPLFSEAAYWCGYLSLQEGQIDEAINNFRMASFHGFRESMENLISLLKRRKKDTDTVEIIAWENIMAQLSGNTVNVERNDSWEERKVRWLTGRFQQLMLELAGGERALYLQYGDDDYYFLYWEPFEDRFINVYPVFREADKGNTQSQVRLGSQFLTGEGVKQDINEGLFWIDYAARNHEPAAYFEFYKIYRDGIALPRNDEKAQLWLKKAAENYTPAKLEIAGQLLEENGRESHWKALKLLAETYRDDPRATSALVEKYISRWGELYVDDASFKKVLDELADAGDRNALFLKGTHLLAPNEPITIETWRRGIHFLEKAASQDHVQAMLYLALAWINPPEGDKNYNQARRWLLKAVPHRDPEVLYHAAIFLSKGLGGPKDRINAARYMWQSAEAGGEKARRFFPEWNEDLIDMNEAPQWETDINLFRKAIFHNDDQAMLEIGRAFRDGLRDYELDYRQAANWFLKAAEAGNTDACLEMADLYANGKMGIINSIKSLRWTVAAAQRGNAEGAFLAGIQFARGEIINQDLAKAGAFLQQAADTDFPQARELLNTLSGNPGKPAGLSSAREISDYFPLRPMVIEDGFVYPVNGVALSSPIYRVDDNQKSFSRKSSVVLLPNESFAPGEITIESLHHLSPIMKSEEMIIYSYLTPRIVAEMKPDRDYSNCFALLVVWEWSKSPHVYWKGLGRLDANELREVTIDVEEFFLNPDEYTLLLFSDDVEIPTNRRIQPQFLSGSQGREFYESREKYLQDCREAKASHAAEIFDEGIARSLEELLKSTRSRIKLEISPNGYVTHARFSGEASKSERTRILELSMPAFYYPVVNDGKPEKGYLALPDNTDN